MVIPCGKQPFPRTLPLHCDGGSVTLAQPKLPSFVAIHLHSRGFVPRGAVQAL